ncbi:MAG: peptidoglycan editing factor PgeF [Candidatus Poribacteria bacterium]|nr:peptidoglycan editing factor PgeF [Candidatus Poribacteria bacterium]
MIRYHVVDAFEKTGLVQAVTSIRRGGVSRAPYHSLNLGAHVDDDSAAVSVNRQIFFRQIGLDARHFVHCRQIHSNRVWFIDPAAPLLQASPVEADAIITAHPSLAPGVFTADCVPIFILDAATPAIGMVHAGWRGTLTEIAAQTIRAMREHFGTAPSACLAHLGPSIQKCCYTVSISLADQFEQAFGPRVRSDECTLDLQTANANQLLQAGVPPDAISVSPFCTACRTDLFYSHRAEGGRTGRMLSLIRLHGD